VGVGPETQVPRQLLVVQPGEKGVQVFAGSEHDVAALLTRHAELGPGCAGVTQTPLWTPLAGGSSVGVQVSGVEQDGVPVMAHGIGTGVGIEMHAPVQLPKTPVQTLVRVQDMLVGQSDPLMTQGIWGGDVTEALGLMALWTKPARCSSASSSIVDNIFSKR